MLVLVIGATGQVGCRVVEQLLERGVAVRALVRNARAALPPGVEAARGDLTVPGTLDACLSGVARVFLVWTAPPAAVDGALEQILRHARRLVFLSSPHDIAHPLFQAGKGNPMAAMQARIERLIADSGAEWTFLRPGMFADNARGWWAAQMRAGDVVRWPYLAAATAPVDTRDIAAVAVRALCEDGHAGAEYGLTGPASLTQAEQIAIIGRALGRPVRGVEITPEEARRELQAIMPLPVIEMLLRAWAAAVGRDAWVTRTVEDVTGTPARSFLEWAEDHARDFGD